MTTTVKAADAAQFLSFIPLMLGYLPSRSVVVLPLAEGRSLGAMRFDLPSTEGSEVGAYASTVVGMVCRVVGAEGFIAVVYSDMKGRGELPHADVTKALSRAAGASGLTLFDALVVCADGWGSHCDDTESPARPLSQLTHRAQGIADEHAAGTAAPEVRGDQSSGAALPRRTAAERRTVHAAHSSLTAALAVVCGMPPDDERTRPDPAALEAACRLDEMPRLFESALTWDLDAPDPMDVALLAWCLDRPSLRDIALVQWAGDEHDGAEALRAQQRWEDGEEYPVDLAAIMWGEGTRPDPHRLESALAITRVVAALTAKRRRAGALASCAWLSWALGRSTHAERYASLALTCDADHGLAEIVRSFVVAAHLPDWAFQRAR